MTLILLMNLVKLNLSLEKKLIVMKKKLRSGLKRNLALIKKLKLLRKRQNYNHQKIIHKNYLKSIKK